MKLPSLCAVALLFLAASLSAQGLVTPKPEDAARDAASSWLTLLDDAKYAESWTAAAPSIQKLVPLERWNKAMAAVRTPFGKLVSRTLKDAKFTVSLPGAPDGQYVILQYQTVFENKASALETVTPMRDPEGSWKVAGYYVK